MRETIAEFERKAVEDRKWRSRSQKRSRNEGKRNSESIFREQQGISTGSAQEDVQSQNGSPQTFILGKQVYKNIGAKSWSSGRRTDSRRSTSKRLSQPKAREKGRNMQNLFRQLLSLICLMAMEIWTQISMQKFA